MWFTPFPTTKATKEIGLSKFLLLTSAGIISSVFLGPRNPGGGTYYSFVRGIWVRRRGRILLFCAAGLVVLLAVAITFTIGWRPFIGPRVRATTNRQFERTPERLARGKYLVQGLLSCESCHTPSDWTQHGAPSVAGMELAGQSLPLGGFPGTAVAPNLTPDRQTGAAGWTDDQIARAIREGIKHDGTTMFPLMPMYAYVRTLQPVKHRVDNTLAATYCKLCKQKHGAGEQN